MVVGAKALGLLGLEGKASRFCGRKGDGEAAVGGELEV